MALGSYLDLPGAQEKAYKKIAITYQGTKSAIIQTPYRFLSREQIAALKSRTWMKDVAAAWKLLDAATKLLWKTAGAYSTTRGYSLFMSEYSYRRKNLMSLPPTPNQLHQLYGLKIANAGGSAIIKAQRFDIVVTGPITVSFNYNKIQRAVTTGLPFRCHAIAYYMDNGENKYEEYTFDAPTGNVAWVNEEFTFGTSGRYYFELIITFELNNYDADVILDNFLVTDNIGVLVSEPWKLKAGKPWVYQPRTRKMGWEFTPDFDYPEFQIVFTG